MRKIVQGFFMLMLSTTLALAQEKTVSGTVTANDDGLPIPGASVKVKGSTSGTQTNADGKFTIKVNGDNATLILSYLGYITLEVSTKNEVLNLVLQKDNKSLSEVIVTGYATKSKRDFTGSASQVSIESAMGQPNASFDQLLQGQAAGLNVKTGSGQPGRSADVIIRGQGSINGSSAPLYILDGIEILGGDFSTMNQNDFESVTILKDASSTSIYGSRGSNGVIVITSKQGKTGKLKITYDGQTGMSRLPENQLKVMNTSEKLFFEKNIAKSYPNRTDEDYLRLGKINTNWNDYVFRKGATQSHQLALSGGSDKTTFYTSLGYYNEDGITINTGIKKYNGRLNIRHTDKNLTIGTNLSGGWSDYNGTREGNQGIGSPLNNVLWSLPYEPVYQDDGKTFFGNSTESLLFGDWVNPVEALTVNISQRWQLKSTGNVFLDYKLPWIKNLSYKINMGGDYSQIEDFNLIPNGSQTATQNGIRFGKLFRLNGEVERALDRRFSYTITNSLNYKTNLDAEGNHKLNTSVYYEYVRNQGRSFNFTGYGLLLPFKNETGLVEGTAANGFIPSVGGGFPVNNAVASFFGDVAYSYKNRYFLSLTGRNDGSSRLSPANRYVSYGSVGASWILSDEDFFKNINFVSLAKIKASYGNAANQGGIGQFPYSPQYIGGTYGGLGTLQIGRLGNPNLKWELKEMTNIGIDAEFFKGRIRTSFEWYNNNTKGLYFEPNVPSINSAGAAFTANAGNLQNRGIETTVDFKLINTKDFKWSIGANYSFNKNTIKSLDTDQPLLLTPRSEYQALQVGSPVNSFYLVQFAGVDPKTGNSQFVNPATGQLGAYSANNKVILGTSDAPHNAGINLMLGYKGIELTALGILSGGNYIFNKARYNLEWNILADYAFAANGLNAWTTEGQITDFPRITESTRRFTTRFLEKGDFFRLKNIQLAYSLPNSVLTKIKIQGLRFFIQGQNLYTKFKFQGWDPEVSTINNPTNSNATVEGAQYPSLKRVTFGVNLTL